MGSCDDGVDSSSLNDNSASESGCSSGNSFDFATPLPSPSVQYMEEGTASESNERAGDCGTNSVCRSLSSGFHQKHSRRTLYGSTGMEKASKSVVHHLKSHKGSSNSDHVVDRTKTIPSLNQVNLGESESCVNLCSADSGDGVLNRFLALEGFDLGSTEGGIGEAKSQSKVQAANGSCPSPQSTLYTATVYAEAKKSLSITEVCKCSSDIQKSSNGSGKINDSPDLKESLKTSTYRSSTAGEISDYSSSSSLGSAMSKPHKANDTRWEAIKTARSRFGVLGPNQFSLLKGLGCGDIGSVYLVELRGTGNYFAVKVMEKEVLTRRRKMMRAQTEREILKSLDHPFLPTLYAHFETNRFSCLVMEYCSGGDLHALRRRQQDKYFPEDAARFYAAEVLLALEYLHMLGIIYRDLKPENVLVRSDGHIMLSDFDLSLRCVVSPTLVKSSRKKSGPKDSGHCVKPSGLVQSVCLQPTCFSPGFLSGKPKKDKASRSKNEKHKVINLPELLAEPTNARSNSFVGTHEYLAPEIIRGECHGSAVDWWTFGIFLYELLFGRTPFKGQGSRATLFNVVGQPLKFPETPNVSFAAKDLIRGLLAKEPQHRISHRRGATEVKQHPFFQSINWALIRCTKLPDVPIPAAINIPSGSNAPKHPIKVAKPALDLQASGKLSRDGLFLRESENSWSYFEKPYGFYLFITRHRMLHCIAFVLLATSSKIDNFM